MNVTVAQLDATWVNPTSVQYNAQELRRADAPNFNGDGSAFGVRGGIVRHGDTSLACTVNGSDQLTVQAGPVVIPGNTGANGAYRAALGAATTVTLEARNASLPRMDIVVFRELDFDVVAAHGSGNFTGRIEVLTGTPNATPLSGAQLPLAALMVELCRITVPATGGGAATVDNSNRTYAVSPGAFIPVPTAARLPATAPLFERAVALDTGVQYVWSGTRWVDQTVSSATATADTIPPDATYVQISNLSITKPGGPETVFVVNLVVDLDLSANTGGICQLFVDGVAQSGQLISQMGASGTRQAQSRFWIIRGLADGNAHVFSARVNRFVGSGTVNVHSLHSTLSVESKTSA